MSTSESNWPLENFAGTFVSNGSFYFLRYCVVFKVDKAMSGCRRSKETEALKRGESPLDCMHCVVALKS